MSLAWPPSVPAVVPGEASGRPLSPLSAFPLLSFIPPSHVSLARQKHNGLGIRHLGSNSSTPNCVALDGPLSHTAWFLPAKWRRYLSDGCLGGKSGKSVQARCLASVVGGASLSCLFCLLMLPQSLSLVSELEAQLGPSGGQRKDVDFSSTHYVLGTVHQADTIIIKAPSPCTSGILLRLIPILTHTHTHIHTFIYIISLAT